MTGNSILFKTAMNIERICLERINVRKEKEIKNVKIAARIIAAKNIFLKG